MKFLLLFAIIGVCTASTLYRGRNVVFKDDGTIEITQPGKKISINPITGHKRIEIDVTGTRKNPKKFLIDTRKHPKYELDEELRELRQSEDRTQGEILAEIFKDYEGSVNAAQFEELLERVDEAVKRGEINPRIYNLLEKLERDRSSEEEEEEEEEEVEEREREQRRRGGFREDSLGWLSRIPGVNLGRSTGRTTDILRQVQQQQLTEIYNRLQRLLQLQQQQPTSNIVEQVRIQQELGNIIDVLQRQIQHRQVQLRQCLQQSGGVGLNLREQQEISDIIDLLQQQQQIQFEQTLIIPGLTSWQQQQQISITINGLQRLLQQQQECQQTRRFGGFGRLQQQEQERAREIQQLLEQQRGEDQFGLTGPRRQIAGLTPWQQQRIEQLLEQQARLTPWQQQQQQQEPLIIGMTENVKPFQGFVDTDGLKEIVGARVGDQVVFHTLPSSRRVVPQELGQRDIFGRPQPIQELVY